MRILLAVVLVLMGSLAHAKPRLCMDTVPAGDKFYAECRKCEKNVRFCSGDLRDRMRELSR
jgi:hypothetical protein